VRKVGKVKEEETMDLAVLAQIRAEKQKEAEQANSHPRSTAENLLFFLEKRLIRLMPQDCSSSGDDN